MGLLKKRSLSGAEGIKYLWEVFSDVPFFEIPFPVERDAGTRLPLLTEAADPKFLHPYLKISRTLSTNGELRAGRKLLMLDLSENRERARRVAVNLSLVFAFEKIKVILVDFDLHTPTMHRLLGMRNLDGLTDHLLLGTPVSDIVRETNIPGLSLVTRGRQIEITREFLREIAWESVLGELTPVEGISLCVLTREGGSGEDEMLPCFDGLLLFFCEPYSISWDTRGWLRDLGRESHVSGILWSQDILIDSRGKEKRGDRAAFEGGNKVNSREEHSRPGTDPAQEPRIAARGTREGGAMSQGEKDMIETESPPEVPEEEPVLTPQLGKRVRLSRPGEGRGFELLGPVLLIFGLFAVILAGLLWWGGYFSGKRDAIVLEEQGTEYLAEDQTAAQGETQVPLGTEVRPGTEVPIGETQVAEQAPPAGEAVPASVPASPAATIPPPAALAEADFFYTINVASYTDDKWAKRGLETLTAAGMGAYLVPVEITGKGPWIRLMLGSFGNKDDAQREMERLAAEGVLKEGWVMRTPYAFLVGEWRERSEATTAMASLTAQGLFPYMVSRGEGGAERHRVFLGAFQGKDQASSLEKILRGMGHRFTLVERRG